MTDNNVTISIDTIDNPTPIKATEVRLDQEIKTEAEAKKFFEGFRNFLKSGSMEKKAEEISRKTGLPPKEVSKRFFLRVLGILGTGLEIVVNTAGDIVSSIINLIGRLLLGGVDLIMRTAKRLVRVVTLNQGMTA